MAAIKRSADVIWEVEIRSQGRLEESVQASS
jgi:hypothetical protein